MRSLLESTIITLAKLYSESDDRSIIKFVNFIEQNAKDIGNVTVVSRLVNKHREEFVKFEEAIQYLYTWRNKSYAHYDKKYFYDSDKLAHDAPLLIGYIRKLIQLAGRIINDYQKEFNGYYSVFEAENKYDIDKLLERVKITEGSLQPNHPTEYGR